METKLHIPILKRLFVSYVFDNKYTFEELKKTHETEVQPSDFFKNFKFNKLHSVDGLTTLLETILNDEDSPSFELKYKIYIFYSKLTSHERKLLHDFYIGCFSNYEIETNLNFDENIDKTPKDLSKFIFYNSVNFFDEFDISDGFIDIEYLLKVIDNYANDFKVDVNQIFNYLIVQ